MNLSENQAEIANLVVDDGLVDEVVVVVQISEGAFTILQAITSLHLSATFVRLPLEFFTGTVDAFH